MSEKAREPHSKSFEADTEIIGYLKLTLWMSLDLPDTDFQVTVYEIQSVGRSISLSGDMKRARDRESLRREGLLKPGEVNRYDFKTVTWFARRVARGSRLRLVINSPNSIYWQKNYNRGGVVANESKDDVRTAHVTLHHDAGHASCVEVPVVRASPKP